jgi:hypothetical protein
VSINPAQNGTAKFVFGYDRDVYSIVPRVDPASAPTVQQANGVHQPPASAQEAMTLASFSKARVVGIDQIMFRNFIAAGNAAIQVAKDPDGLRMLREAIFAPAPAPNKP